MIIHLGIDIELVLQHHIPPLIDALCLVTIILLPSIHRTPLPVPYTQTLLVHPAPLTLVRVVQYRYLRFRPCVRFRRIRKSVDSIIVYRIRCVRPASPRVLRKF